MNDYFSHLIEQYGPPTDAEPFGADDARLLRGRLPEALLAFWVECGIGSWLNAKLQFWHPDKYASIVKMILDGDPEYPPEKTHLYAYGAFGELQLWNEDRNTMSVNLPYLRARAAATRPNWSKGNEDAAIVSTLFSLDDKTSLTLFENTPSTPPMFDKCVKKYGKLERGECYGLFPALALGGSTKVANVKRVPALEHFALLAQLGPVRLTIPQASGDVVTIRTLGAVE